MSKILLKTINTCSQCPYLTHENLWDEDRNTKATAFYCRQHQPRLYLGHSSENLNPIPTSCPLPDNEISN